MQGAWGTILGGVGVGGKMDPPTRQLLVVSVMCPFVGLLLGRAMMMGRGAIDGSPRQEHEKKYTGRLPLVPRPNEAIPASRLETKLKELSLHRDLVSKSGSLGHSLKQHPGHAIALRSSQVSAKSGCWGRLCQGSAMDTVDATVHSTSSWSLHLWGGGGDW